MAKRVWRTSISVEEARESLDYDPDTGVFTWRKSTKRGRAGEVAGCVHRNGYRRIGLCGALIYAHRLAWLMSHGKMPDHEIDHINGNKDDNRLCNLRGVVPRINNQNHQPRASTLVGVYPARGGRWRTQIRLLGIKIVTSSVPTEEQAHEIYLGLKRRLHEGCSHW